MARISSSSGRGNARSPAITSSHGATGSHRGSFRHGYTPSPDDPLLRGSDRVKDQYQVVVIGGGIVGCSVLYHLTLRGMTDIALIEREELTAGSTWHAAGGFHAMNADTRVAALQKYTIGLYPQVEAESGQSVGLHMSGGMELA